MKMYLWTEFFFTTELFWIPWNLDRAACKLLIMPLPFVGVKFELSNTPRLKPEFNKTQDGSP